MPYLWRGLYIYRRRENNENKTVKEINRKILETVKIFAFDYNAKIMTYFLTNNALEMNLIPMKGYKIKCDACLRI